MNILEHNLVHDVALFEKDRMRHCLHITEDLILNELPDEIIKELYKGFGKDLDGVLDSVVKECYRILYGRVGSIKPNIKEVTELDNFVEDELRRQDLVYFCQTALSEFDVNWHHLDWGLLIQNYNFVAIQAARDHGKSWFTSLGYPLWRAYRYRKNSPNRYDRLGRQGYIFSASKERATELLELIKLEVENNDYLRDRLYPNGRDGWSKSSLTFKGGATVRSRGFTSNVRGAHPGWMVMDDVVTDNVLYSEVQRERNKERFNAVHMNMIVPQGQVIVVGTPFHYKDLYALFRPEPKLEGKFDEMYKENGWVYAVYPAIDKYGRLLWKERHDEHSLNRKRKTQGNIIFSRELLCEPITSDSSLFPLRLLQKAYIGMEHFNLVGNIEAFKVKVGRVITGCDFSMSAEVGADYTAFLTWGEDDFKNRYLMNVFHEKGVGFFDQVLALETIGRNFHPDIMLLEANQFQAIYTQYMTKMTTLPVKPFVTGRKKTDLKIGVPGLVLLFENGRIKFPRGNEYDILQTNKIVNEFNHIGFTDKGIQGIGEHDDLVMATWLSMNAFDYDPNDFLMEIIGG